MQECSKTNLYDETGVSRDGHVNNRLTRAIAGSRQSR